MYPLQCPSRAYRNIFAARRFLKLEIQNFGCLPKFWTLKILHSDLLNLFGHLVQKGRGHPHPKWNIKFIWFFLKVKHYFCNIIVLFDISWLRKINCFALWAFNSNIRKQHFVPSAGLVHEWKETAVWSASQRTWMLG